MDFERTAEFILQQQAKFAADMAEMGSFVARIAQQQLEMTQHVNHFHQEIGAAVLAIAEQQKLLAEAHTRLEEAHARMEEAHAKLEDAQRHTEERLNALIGVVDGIVRRPPQP